MAREKQLPVKGAVKDATNDEPAGGTKPGDPSEPENAGRSPADFEKVGPRSIEGVEVSDLPDKGRGDVYTDFGKEAARNVPHHTGETVGPDATHETGLRGTPELSDADQHGHS